MTSQQYFHGTGRRKPATARVRLYPGAQEVIVNGRGLKEALPRLKDRRFVEITPDNFDAVLDGCAEPQLDGASTGDILRRCQRGPRRQFRNVTKYSVAFPRAG